MSVNFAKKKTSQRPLTRHLAIELKVGNAPQAPLRITAITPSKPPVRVLRAHVALVPVDDATAIHVIGAHLDFDTVS